MIRLVLRLFPAEWRDRYGAELADLVAQEPLTPRVVIDVARAGMSERARSARSAIAGGEMVVLGPAWRHPTAWALAGLLVIVPTLSFVALSMLTYQLGFSGLSAVADPLNRWLDGQRVLDLVLVVSPAVGLVLAATPLVRVTLTTAGGDREATIGLRLRGLNVLVALVAVGLGGLLVWHIVAESVLGLGA